MCFALHLARKNRSWFGVFSKVDFSFFFPDLDCFQVRCVFVRVYGVFIDTTKRLMSSPKCRSVEIINNPARPGSNHREVNCINNK
jgi:hypothetical protein